MKHYTNKELTEILDSMICGEDYCGIDKHNRGIGHIFSNGEYIYYNHFGSSATKANISGLKFILNTIFDDCELVVPCEYSDYHINYIPKSKNYIGIDLSTKHPNVCGL